MATTYNYALAGDEVQIGIVSAGLTPSSVSQPGAVAATFAAPLDADEQAALDQVMADLGYVFVSMTTMEPGTSVAAAPGDGPLTIVEGRVDTTLGTILSGGGFQVTKNGIGDVTITFDAEFRRVPAVVANAEAPTPLVSQATVVKPTTTSVELYRTDGALPKDGVVSFLAVGLFP